MSRADSAFERILYAIILFQFIAIVLLLGGLSNEYQSNVYMRAWVALNAPMLDLLLNGAVDALLVGVAAGGTILLVRQRSLESNVTSTSTKRARPDSTLSQTKSAGARPSTITDSETVLLVPVPLPEKPEDVLAELEKQDV